MRKQETIIKLIAAIFLCLFLYTSLSKLDGISMFQRTLSKSPLLHRVAGATAWSIPIIEIAIAVCLFLPATRKWGLYASFALMLLFTGYIGYMLAVTPELELPCGCGGIFKSLNWTQHLWLNGVLTVLAFIGILLDRKQRKGIGTPNDYTLHQISPI